MVESPEIEPAREGGRSFEEILLDPSIPAERLALVGSDSPATWGELRQLADGLVQNCAGLARRRVGLLFSARPTSLATLALLDRLGCDAFIIDPSLDRSEASQLGRELGLGAILQEQATPSESTLEQVPLQGELPGSGQSTVTLLTSGTGGKPKAARHYWPGLTRQVRASGDGDPPVWLLAYRPHLGAGLHVMLQCLGTGGTLVAPDPDAGPGAIAELMRSARVAYGSATPSYWRRLLHFADPLVLRSVPLTKITLAGEVVDQHILDGLKAAFPSAGIMHVYATTELGRCFSVTDGRAGFPASYLGQRTRHGVELAIEDGELVVRSPHAMQGYDVGGVTDAPVTGRAWPTGDLVEAVGDRVFFVGRRTDIINVGGNKVAPLEVERVLRGVPGVADARVFGRRSSIAGELVACQVVAAAELDPEQLREEIVTACVANLRAYQRPRAIEFVSEIPLERSGKTNRGAES